MQCHIEIAAEIIFQWFAKNRKQIVTPSDSVQDQAAITGDMDNKINILCAVTNVIYTHWGSVLKE